MDPAKTNQRRHKDMMTLMLSKYDVKVEDEKSGEFYVTFLGPQDTPYEGEERDAESIGFANKIFHPNVDEASGSICLDVLNQSWSPMYELKHIFDVFLPQLLQYPNPVDPLNAAAASLFSADPEKYKMKVKEYVQKYARSPELLARAEKQMQAEKAAKESEDKAAHDHDADSNKDSELSATSLKSEEEEGQ